MANALTKPGARQLLGAPVDLAKVDTDTYVVAGIADHLCPWQSCYRTTQLLGGDVRFVLSTSGHIASMVNPPGNPKARFQAAPGHRPPAAREPGRPARLAGRGADHRGQLVAGLCAAGWPSAAAGGATSPDKAGPARATSRSTRRPAPMSSTAERAGPMRASGAPRRRPSAARSSTASRCGSRSGRQQPRPPADPRRCCSMQRHRRQPGGCSSRSSTRSTRAIARDPVRRARRRRLAAAASPLPLHRPGRLVAEPARPARPPAGRRARHLLGRRRWPSTLPPSSAAAAGGWCWSAPRPAR